MLNEQTIPAIKTINKERKKHIKNIKYKSDVINIIILKIKLNFPYLMVLNNLSVPITGIKEYFGFNPIFLNNLYLAITNNINTDIKIKSYTTNILPLP